MITWLRVHPAVVDAIVIGCAVAALITLVLMCRVMIALTRPRAPGKHRAPVRPGDVVWGDLDDHDTAWDLAVTDAAGHETYTVPPHACDPACSTMVHTGPVALEPLPEWQTTQPRHARAETIHLPPWEAAEDLAVPVLTGVPAPAPAPAGRTDRDGEPQPVWSVNIVNITIAPVGYSDDGWTTSDPSLYYVQQILEAPFIDGELQWHDPVLELAS